MESCALRAPEVILGLGWGPATDIWGLGFLVLYLLLVFSLCVSLTTFSLKMYEFATGCRLSKSKVVNDISRDIVHLAQITQRTGQSHNVAVLKECGNREAR